VNDGKPWSDIEPIRLHPVLWSPPARRVGPRWGPRRYRVAYDPPGGPPRAHLLWDEWDHLGSLCVPKTSSVLITWSNRAGLDGFRRSRPFSLSRPWDWPIETGLWALPHRFIVVVDEYDRRFALAGWQAERSCASGL